MKLPLKYAMICGLAFGAVVAACLIWYAFLPSDQLLLVSILALPADLLFFAIAIVAKDWPAAVQMSVIGLLGFLQYGTIGYLIGRVLSKTHAG